LEELLTNFAAAKRMLLHLPAARGLAMADQFDEKRLELIGKATAVELDYRASVLSRI